MKEYRPSRLALRAVDGYLTRTQGGIQAWFVEPPVAWSMRKSEDREARIVARAQRYAELAEQDVVEVHMRVTHRPWPVGQWARDHDRWARQASPPPGDVPGALSWDALMHGEQRSQYAEQAENGPGRRSRHASHSAAASVSGATKPRWPISTEASTATPAAPPLGREDGLQPVVPPEH